MEKEQADRTFGEPFSRMEPASAQPLIRSLIYCALLFAFLAVASGHYIATIKDGSSFIAQQYLGFAAIAQFAVLSACMLFCWRLGPHSQNYRDYYAFIVIGLIARLITLWLDPYLSNDIDRYLFDGKIALSGLDPYSVSHDTPQLAALVEQWQPPIEHRQYVSLYPPLAMAAFTFAATAGPEFAPLLWKLIVTAVSIATLWFGMRVLKQARKLQHSALLCLSPLLIIEAGVGAHLDALLALTVVMAIYYWQTARLAQCGLWIGIGTLIKLLPLAMLVPFFFALPGIRSRLHLSLAAIGTVIIGYLAALAYGWLPLGSLGTFFEKWRFGSPVYSMFESLWPNDNIWVVTGILSTIAVGCSIAIARKDRQNDGKDSLASDNVESVYLALAVILTTPLLLSPVVFPWYLSALVPVMILVQSRLLLAFILLMPLTYEVLGGFACCNRWEPAAWPLWAVGLSLAFCAIAYRWKRRWPFKMDAVVSELR